MKSGAPAVSASRPQLALFIGAAVVISLIMGVNIVTLDHMRRNTLQSAESDLTGYSNVVAEQAAASFRSVDVVLSGLADHFAREGVNDAESFATELSNDATHRMLKERAAGMPQLSSFMLVDSRGRVVASSLDGTFAGLNLADRDYFQALRNDPTLESFVSAPLLSRATGLQVIPFARRLSDPNGNFMGVMMGAVLQRALSDYYDAIVSGRMTRVSLLRADGVVLAQHPSGPARPVVAAANPLRFDAVMRLSDPRSGEKSLVSARRIVNFPIVAVVSQSEKDILSNWSKMAWLLTLISTCNAGLVVVVSFVIARRWQAQSFLLGRLAESEGFARQKSQQFETTLANLPQGLCMFDRDMRIVVANDQYARLYDLSPEDARAGASIAEVVERRIARGIYADRDPEDIRRGELAPQEEKTLRLHRLTNGRMISVARYVMPEGGWISQHTDVTEEYKAMERINFLARHDSLTRLFNRAQLIDRMSEALAGLPPFAGLCVLLLDLDMFKTVNDRLGHGVGDKLLVEVGQRLLAATRAADVVARLGGDEFAILLVRDVRELREGAEALAERLVARIGEPYDIDAHHIAIGASVGIASAPEDGLNVDGLMLKADLALYKAKAAGRSGYRFYDASLEREALARRNLQKDLHAAIAGEQFELVYQPIVCARTLDIVAAEALVRWRHPREGLIGPDRFIPIAEETGMIAPLGDWILRRACAEASNWPPHLHVAVNISPVQFKKGDLIKTVDAALAETRFPAHRLELEITENVFMENSEENLGILQALKRLGLSISLDDFGAGYSSLAYIRAFLLDKIKIDRSFVAEALHRRESAAIVAAIVNLGHSLDIATVAEGVETEAQHQFLRSTGCTYYQGYYFGKPVSAREMQNLCGQPATEVAE